MTDNYVVRALPYLLIFQTVESAADESVSITKRLLHEISEREINIATVPNVYTDVHFDP